MQYVLPVPPTIFQLCGGDVFMSDFKGLNIFSKSWFLSTYSYVLSNYLLLGVQKKYNCLISEEILITPFTDIVNAARYALICH